MVVKTIPVRIESVTGIVYLEADPGLFADTAYIRAIFRIDLDQFAFVDE